MKDEQAFWWIAQTGSFAAAARKLNIARSTVLRRLENLEQDLDVSLIQRAGKKATLTEAGRQYAEGLRPILNELDTLRQRTREFDGRIAGTLRVWVPQLTMGELVSRAFAAFYEFAPKVLLRIEVGSHGTDRQPEEFDIALQTGMEANPNLRARVLFREPIVLVASPGYLQQHGTPQSKADLADHKGIFVLDELSDATVTRSIMPWWDEAGERLPMGSPSAIVNSQEMALHLVCSGVGMTPASLSYAVPLLQAGTIVPVLPHVIWSLPVSLVFLPKPTRTTRAFIDFLVAWCRENIVQETERALQRIKAQTENTRPEENDMD